MKLFSLFAIAIAAISLVSCNKELNEAEVPVAGDNTTFSVSILDDNDTKTTLDGRLVKWAAGDQIRVYGYSSTGTDSKVYTLKSGAGTRSAVFENTADPIGAFDQYFAVYPAEDKYNLKTASLPGKMEINSAFNLTDQEAVENGFDPSFALMLATADSERQLSFKYGVGFIKITIPVDNVTEVSISGSNSWTCKRPEYNVDGSLNKANSGTKEVTATGSFVKGSSYYLLAPSRGTSFGTITVKYTIGGTTEEFTGTVSTSIENGKIFDLGTPWAVRTPELTVLKSSINNVPAAGGTGLTSENAYSLKYCNDSDITVTTDGSVVTAASISGGTITYSVAENTSTDAIVGYIYLKLGSNDAEAITVNQLASGTSVTTVTYTWDFSSYYSEAITLGAGDYTYKAAEDESAVLTYHTSKTNDKIAKSNGLYYLQPNGSASATDRVLSFTSPGKGTLTITGCSNGSNTRTLTVKDSGGNTITATSGGSSSSSTPTDHIYSVPSGTIIIYPDNIFRFYKLVYTNE